jgi:hypothetical protein
MFRKIPRGFSRNLWINRLTCLSSAEQRLPAPPAAPSALPPEKHGALKFDALVKSRHPGESRGPVLFNPSIFLDTGFRRYDVTGEFATFYEFIKFDALIFTGVTTFFKGRQASAQVAASFSDSTFSWSS